MRSCRARLRNGNDGRWHVDVLVVMLTMAVFGVTLWLVRGVGRLGGRPE